MAGGGSRDRKNSSALWIPAFLLAIICCSRQTYQSCADGIRSVNCYECNSNDNDADFCVDPFNRTHLSIRITTCQGPCVKWLKKPPNGPVQYIRTCSKNLYLRISVALVCMRESRPGDGELCFCHRDRCNSLPSMHDPTSHARTTTLALCLVVSLLATVFSIPTQSVVSSGTLKTSSETLEAASASRKASGAKCKGSATSKASSVTSRASSPISKLSSANLEVLSASQKESPATTIVSAGTSKYPFAHSKISSAESKALALTSNVKSVTIKASSATLLFFIIFSSVKELSLLFSSSTSELQSTCQKHVTAMNFRKQVI